MVVLIEHLGGSISQYVPTYVVRSPRERALR